MSMMRFGLLFPDVAELETRTAKIFEATPAKGGRSGLPADEYGFVELYCDERGCDCRRVMINVIARRARQHVATINHAFEKPSKKEPVQEQTFLDPLNRQSPLAPALLDLFVNVVLADARYRQRLIWHYQMFKRVVDDPTHPAHRLLRNPPSAFPDTRPPTLSDRPIPPPPRRGKRKKWR